MRIVLMLVGVVVATGSLPGCGAGRTGGDGLQVTATTTQVADFVRAVGGKRVGVAQILRPNADPHEYEPRPSDALALARAALVFRSGGDVDQWLAGLVAQAGQGVKVVTLSDRVKTLPGDGGSGIDPHWWQDPRNAELAVTAIRDALIAADPKGRADYDRNARAYLQRLGHLDTSVAACINRVPQQQRKLVTSHDALGYYTRRYGIALIGTAIPSLSTQAQPSGASIKRLAGLIRRERVKAIFPEASVNAKLEHAIARDTGARIGRPLWADSLGPAGSTGATYVDSLASNTQALVDGFTGGRVQCRPSA